MKLGQVWWGYAMEALVGKNAKLESDALATNVDLTVYD